MKTIALHRAAPPQPPPGAPCNGCGVCCAARICPPGILLLRQGRGPCRALRWNTAQQRYQCGLLTAPRDYLPWLPKRLERHASTWLYRRIAAGHGCDCRIEIETEPATPRQADGSEAEPGSSQQNKNNRN